MSRDAWKDTGDCSECRRNKYCKKQCTANRKHLDRFVEANFDKAVTDILNARSSTAAPSKDRGDMLDAMLYAAERLKTRS